MKNIFLGMVIAFVLFLGWQHFIQKNSSNSNVSQSGIIQQQLKNVGKLVVVEGHFSDVLNYKNSKPLFTEMFSAQKKALVVVNARVTISYDLSQLTYIIDEDNKVLQLTAIPEEEVNIHPELQYYDVQSDFFNPFDAKDYNAISKTVKTSLTKKIEESSFKKNAKHQLLAELSKLYILTNSMGWTLKYKEELISNTKQLEL